MTAQYTVIVHHRDGGSMVPVAKVSCPPRCLTPAAALEYAWRWTNNTTGSWSIGKVFLDPGQEYANDDHNLSVTRLAPLHEDGGHQYGLRSSMMGDLFSLAGNGPVAWYVVASLGFEEIAIDGRDV